MQPNVEKSTKDKPLVVNILDSPVPLPQNATIGQYKTFHKKKLLKDAFKKIKYKSFSYFKVKKQDSTVIIKVLFVDADNYLLVGEYPFVIERYEIKKVQELNDTNPERLTICQALLIGDRNNQLIVRKTHLCKIIEEQGAIDTVQDDFQTIPMANEVRYTQVKRYLKEKLKQNYSHSLRVFIQEDGEQARVLDYNYFSIEKKALARYVKQA